MSSVRASAARFARRIRAVRRDDLVALWWTLRVLPGVRRDLEAVGTAVRVPPPPPGLSLWAGRTVATYLDLRHATCLERSVVLQRWLVAHGRPVPVVIGVGTRDNAFSAHAWLPGYDAEDDLVHYQEISRIEPDCA